MNYCKHLKPSDGIASQFLEMSITFSDNHGVLTGDTVTYAQNGATTAVGGLTDGRNYGVIVEDDNSFKLGATFDSLASDGMTPRIDLATDTITFSGAHNLEDGDRVVYTPEDTSAVIGGLVSGNTYIVKRIDDTSIKLIDPNAIPDAPKDFSGSNISGNAIIITAHDFVDGQAVTYRAPEATEFGQPAVDDGADNINLGSGHGFVSGDEVIYTTEGTEIGGLTSGDRYFVIFDENTPDVIQLAETVGGTAIALTPSSDSALQSEAHNLRKVEDLPIGGLNDGETYYVDRINNNRFRLVDGNGQTVTPDPTDSVSGATLTGTNTLGTEGIDLTSEGSGSHRLVLDITSQGSDTQIFEGVGGARALAGAPSGDGVVTAAASGSGGGAVRVSGAKTSASATPTLNVIVGDNAQLSARDIDIDGTAKSNVSALSANSGGGVVSVGKAEANVSLDAASNLTIGSNAVLSAEDTIALNSQTIENANVLAESDGGGLVDIADADVKADINYSSILTIGEEADINAGNSLVVDASSATNVNARAKSDSAGLGSSADTTADLNLGGGTDNRALTQTILGAGTRLQANQVQVSARVTQQAHDVEAESESGGAVADADAKATIDIYDTVEVNLDDNSTITGELVTIEASHDGVNLRSRSNGDTDGLYANANSEARGHYDSFNQVTSATGANVAAGELNVLSTQNIDRFERNATADVDVFGSESTSEPGEFLARRGIDWNGNVSFLVSSSPKLLIDSNGLIVTAEKVTVNGGLGEGDTVIGDTITVDPIVNNDGGIASFLVNDVSDRDEQTAPDGVIEGSGGLFSSGSTFASVEIENQSNKDLIIGDISLANGTFNPDVSLNAESVTLEFDVGSLAPGGEVDVTILNEGTGDVEIAGLVDNPLGLIRIENEGGNILSNGASDHVLRGNSVELTADSIGSSTNRLNVDLVRSSGRSNDLSAQSDADIWLNLTGRLRDTNSGNAQFGGGTIEALGDVDILFQSSVQETQSTGTAGGIDVRVNNGPSETYLEHFRPDTGPGGSPLDFRVFADTSQAVTIDGSFIFDQITGTNINVAAANPAATDPRIDLTANTDHAANDQIDVLLNGDITLVETAGDLLSNSIRSNAGDVNLTAAAGGMKGVSATPSVIGNNIILNATAGIGLADDFFEIDSSFQAPGHVRAIANDSIFLTETTGDMSLDGVSSDGADVSLLTLSGSILDGIVEVGGDLADVQGRDIDLVVNGGSIGTLNNDLVVCQV